MILEQTIDKLSAMRLGGMVDRIDATEAREVHAVLVVHAGVVEWETRSTIAVYCWKCGTKARGLGEVVSIPRVSAGSSPIHPDCGLSQKTGANRSS